MSDVNTDTGVILEALNDKADRDLNNINPSASAKETIVGWGIPDYSAGISLNGISSPYTAPKDGVVILERNIGTVYVNGNYVATSGQTYSAYSVFIPVSSGDIVSWTQGTPYNGVFYPLKGV